MSNTEFILIGTLSEKHCPLHNCSWALWHVIKSKYEGDEKDECSNAKLVPSKGAAHEVADYNPMSHHDRYRKMIKTIFSAYKIYKCGSPEETHHKFPSYHTSSLVDI